MNPNPLNPHERLANFVVLNTSAPFGSQDSRISFTKACGEVGALFNPPASANNVWRWCKKGRVPNRRYRASIKTETGVDFSEYDKKKVHGIPVKSIQAAKKVVETRIPVDFQDLLWVYAETPCVGCFIDGGSDECENAVRAITGLKCKSRNFVLKRKPAWEVCTKQNTKVGDVVRRIGADCEWAVRYILENDSPEMMVTNFSGVDVYGPMNLFEVEI